MMSEALFTDAMHHLVRIAAAVAVAPLPVIERVMRGSLGSVTPQAVDEVLLQSYLFAGFPRALNATAAWRKLSGAEAPENYACAGIEAAAIWRDLGESACRTVYGAKYDALRGNISRLHPALDEWMVTDGYGKVLSRPGLSLAQRELCILATCAASEQLPQLRSHLRGALNCGAARDDVERTLDALRDLVPCEALAAAREELTRIKEE